MALDRLGKYQEAIEYYDKAIEIDANFIDAQISKGWALDGLGKYKEAIEYYDKALDIDPINIRAWNNKVILLTI